MKVEGIKYMRGWVEGGSSYGFRKRFINFVKFVIGCQIYQNGCLGD